MARYYVERSAIFMGSRCTYSIPRIKKILKEGGAYNIRTSKTKPDLSIISGRRQQTVVTFSAKKQDIIKLQNMLSRELKTLPVTVKIKLKDW